MAILKIEEIEKQTVNRSDKGFSIWTWGEIRVAYGEMCLAVMEMMTEGIEEGVL